MSDDERNGRESTTTARQEYQALLSAASTTAGSENWKTCAGRLDGPDGFIPSDLYNCMKRSFKRHVKGMKHHTRCPICFEDPLKHDESSTEPRNGWYITKSCNHAVCRECLQSYASAQISDPNHSGPLKCPCCPRLLRVEDAKVALSDAAFDNYSSGKSKHVKNKSSQQDESSLFTDTDHNRVESNALTVLKKWDGKVRDEFLRSMADFRPCPHCSKSKNSSNETKSSTNEGTSPDLNGGGFVTAECLSPINDERESYAERIITFAGATTVRAVLLAYAIYYIFCSQKYSAESPANRLTVLMQVLKALVPGVLVPVFPHVIRLVLARMAKEAIVRPIIVTCPCCNKEFNLEASSEFNLAETLSGSSSESASQNWKNQNTRPCPGCSIPIMKDGGCNHVRCGKCGVNFCWACMRAKSQCKAYKCNNGAPYGNAFGDGSLAAVAAGLAAGEREGRTLMEYIEGIEFEARRNLQQLQSLIARNGLIMIGLYVVTNVFVNHLRLLSYLLLLGMLEIGCINAFPHVVRAFREFTQRQAAHNRTPNRPGGHGLRGNLRQTQTASTSSTRSNGFGFRTEEEMMAEAIARSLVDQ